MRSQERRRLLRTVAVATIAAALTAYGVFKLKNWTTPSRSPRDAFAASLIDAVRATMDAQANAKLTAGPTTIEKQGIAERARDAALKQANALGLARDSLSAALAQADVAAINRSIGQDASNKDSTLELVVAGATRIAVVERWQALHESPSVWLVMPLGQQVAEASDDDWLLEHGMVSVRTAARVLVDKHLLGWLGDFERCPTEYRVDSHLPLGKRLDAAYQAVALTLFAADERAKDRLMPLCRRERLRRLADSALRMAKRPTRFPFLPMLVLNDAEDNIMRTYEDPAKTPGLGAAARAHLTGFAHAESDLKQENSTLRLAVQRALPSVLAELTTQAVVFARVSASKPDVATHWPWFSSIVVEEHSARARGWLCAELATYHHEAYSLRAISRTLDIFTTANWPESGQREGMLAALYVAAGKEPPKEGVAALPQLTALADVLLQATPNAPRVLGQPCEVQAPAELSLSAAQIEDLAERLVP